jgi:hypothetical protein
MKNVEEILEKMPKSMKDGLFNALRHHLPTSSTTEVIHPPRDPEQKEKYRKQNEALRSLLTEIIKDREEFKEGFNKGDKMIFASMGLFDLLSEEDVEEAIEKLVQEGPIRAESVAIIRGLYEMRKKEVKNDLP